MITTQKMEYLTKYFFGHWCVPHVSFCSITVVYQRCLPFSKRTSSSCLPFQELEDSFNYGLFQPPLNGRAGETKMLMLMILMMLSMLLIIMMAMIMTMTTLLVLTIILMSECPTLRDAEGDDIMDECYWPPSWLFTLREVPRRGTTSLRISFPGICRPSWGNCSFINPVHSDNYFMLIGLLLHHPHKQHYNHRPKNFS